MIIVVMMTIVIRQRQQQQSSELLSSTQVCARHNSKRSEDIASWRSHNNSVTQRLLPSHHRTFYTSCHIRDPLLIPAAAEVETSAGPSCQEKQCPGASPP